MQSEKQVKTSRHLKLNFQSKAFSHLPSMLSINKCLLRDSEAKLKAQPSRC